MPTPICSTGQTEEILGSETAEKQLVLIYYDESSFHANEGQSWQWAEEDKLIICAKSQGQGLMVSNFINEHGGYLSLSPEEHEIAKVNKPDIPNKAKVVFKFGAQGNGYWNNKLFMAQVKTAMSIAEFKYPKTQNTVVFLFD